MAPQNQAFASEAGKGIFGYLIGLSRRLGTHWHEHLYPSRSNTSHLEIALSLLHPAPSDLASRDDSN